MALAILTLALAIVGSILTPDLNLRGLVLIVGLGVFLLEMIWLIWYVSASMILKVEGVTVTNYQDLVSPTVAVTEWARVQDVTYKESGLFQSLFNVGTLSFHTASSSRDFSLSWVGDVSRWAAYLEQKADEATA